MSWKVCGSTLVALGLALWATATLADDRRGAEVGLLLGAVAPDEVMTGPSPSVEATLGLRGGAVFARHWGWYVDALYADIGTTNGLGDAATLIGRTGFDWLAGPERDARWLVTFGAGWMVVDYENATTRDFHNPLASIGFGQRIRLGGTRLRWEIRADRTLENARLTDDLLQGYATLGFVWGPHGRPSDARAAAPLSAAEDADGDGVRDKRDRCPDTPAGARVDSTGCALDDDRDGVLNGIDQCPRTRVGDAVGPNGCPADADADGVPDFTDVCAETPAGAGVDEWGCPEDSDGDGVYDGIDACPDTPASAEVDARGCPRDTDGDGTVDGIDRCPGTPPGVPVDSVGCPRDSDGDGVTDDIDVCPDTPADAPAVDARGCPRPQAKPRQDRTPTVLTGVRFGNDSAALTGNSPTALDRVVTMLLRDPGSRVEIGGHTDATGDPRYNLELSQRRAEAVKAYLVEKGIDPAQLTARGYGQTRPLADNDTPEGRTRNRRVELKQTD